MFGGQVAEDKDVIEYQLAACLCYCERLDDTILAQTCITALAARCMIVMWPSIFVLTAQAPS